KDVLASVGARHPLLARREVKRAALLLVTSDRGLCGGFNATMIREAAHFMAAKSVEIGLISVGRKGRDFFKVRGVTVDQHFAQPSRDVRLEELGAITKQIIADYGSGRYDQIFLGYS